MLRTLLTCSVAIFIVAPVYAQAIATELSLADQSPEASTKPAEPKAAEKPNIVFVLFDDMGWAQPPSYWDKSQLRTPNLDQLASQGMRFTDAHSASAVCTPTRYGVLTGRYPMRIGQFGVLTTWSPPIIPASRLTLPALLKQQGYATACVGKWHLGLEWEEKSQGQRSPVGAKITVGPNELGFDYFCGFTHARNIQAVIEQKEVIAHIEPVESQPLLMDKALTWLDGQTADEPFFLYFPMCPPHTPVAPAEEFIGKGGTDAVGNDPNYGDWVFQGDDMLGQIMSKLDEKGLADNTLLIVAADNGAERRAYPPLRASKRSIYEGGHRVPFVVRWPDKVTAGTTWEHTVCLNDIFGTVAELLEVELPSDAAEDSVSFLPALSGGTSSATRDATVHQSSRGDLAIRKADWKLIVHKNGRRELFNLATDARETMDQFTEYPDVANALETLLGQYIKRGRSTPGSEQQNEFDVKLPAQVDDGD